MSFFGIRKARDGATTSGGRRLCTDRSGAENSNRTSPCGLIYTKKDTHKDVLFGIRKARDGNRTRDPLLGKEVLHR